MSDRASDPEAPTPVEGPRIVVTGNGPHLAFGVRVEINGFIHTPEGNKPFALCACGLTQTPPFCDGSHKQITDLPFSEDEIP